MARLAPILLLLLAAGPASPEDAETEDGAKRIAEFRLKKDTTTMRGWILEPDGDGFRFEHLGGKGRRTIRWDDLMPEDARTLRIEFGLEMTEEERLGLIPGHEGAFRGGGSVRGPGVVRADGGSAKVRTRGLVLPYPADRIEKIHDVKIKEEEAYSADEVYIRRLQRRPPEKAEDHRRLADYLYDIGNWDDAQREYGKAIAKDPLLEGDLSDRLADLRDYQEDQAAREVFKRAHKIAVLDGKWQEALADIQAYIDANPGAKRRGIRVMEELEEKWLAKKQALFHAVKNDEFDRSIRSYLVKTKPDLGTARSWVTSELKELVIQKVMERLGLSEAEAEMFLKSKGKGAPHWATYTGGTFVIDRRAKTGDSTKRAVRGDPEDWWAKYNDINTRSTWLKAYAAERLDIFEVVRITVDDCSSCGGTGQVRKQSVQSVAGGKHEWAENCPRCYGARQDRGVGYR